MLGAAVRRLQRNGSNSERRADLDDRPGIAGTHPRQGGHGSVREAEVGDFGDPTELLRGDGGEWREDRTERGVDPDVDGTESLLGPGCGRVDLSRVGHVGDDGNGFPAGLFDFLGAGCQASGTARH